MRLMSMMVVITSFDVSLVYIISDIISEIISIALFVCLVKNMLVAFWFLWHWWQRFLVFISFLVVGFRSHVYYWNSLKGSKRGQKKITLLDDPWVTLWSPPDFVVVWIFRRFLLFSYTSSHHCMERKGINCCCRHYLYWCCSIK